MIELLIALVILSLVISLAYSFFFFSTKSFKTGSNQSNIQQNLRNVATFVQNQVRNAVDLEILEDPSIPIEEYEDAKEYEYIFVEDSHVQYGRFINGEFTKINKSDASGIDYIDLDFIIKKVDDRANLLEFTIIARDEKQNYDIGSTVYLNNIIGREIQEGSIIRYINP